MPGGWGLKVALARFHVTSAGSLRRHGDAARQLDALERRLAVLDRIDAADFDRLKSLGVRVAASASGPDGGSPRP